MTVATQPETLPKELESAPPFLECITRGPGEPVGAEFLAICDNNPMHVTCSRFCPPECGGHPVCDPCYRLGVARGLIKAERV